MMKFDLNAIIQSVATLLLVVTILITWRQLKETARQTKNLEATLRGSAYQQMIQNQTDSRVAFFLQYPDLLRWHLMTRGFESKSETADRIRLYVLVKLDMHENMYLKHLEGSLGEEPWAAWQHVMEVDFSIHEFQEVWGKVDTFYAPVFREHVKGLQSQRLVGTTSKTVS